MSTSVATVQPAFVPVPPTGELPEAPAFTRRRESRWDVSVQPKATTVAEAIEGDELPNLMKQAKRSNLGASILLLAVEDYRGADERNHLSAAKLLYPTDPDYAAHLQWVCGMTGFPMHYLRATLDRLRPQWNAERKRKRR